MTERQRQNFEAIYNYLRLKSLLPRTADVIVVGGSGTRSDMAERAVELYHQGIAPVIVFSGFAHPKFDINEADMLADYANAHGVPESAIIRESRATNTGLNIRLTQAALRQRSISAERVILVHKPYMTRRFLATAQAQWSNPLPAFYVTSVNDSFEEYLAREEKMGLADTMLRSILKDYAVMKTHPSLGYQTPQPIDEKAEVSYRQLIEDGFSAQLINDDLATHRFRHE